MFGTNFFIRHGIKDLIEHCHLLPSALAVEVPPFWK